MFYFEKMLQQFPGLGFYRHTAETAHEHRNIGRFVLAFIQNKKAGVQAHS